MQSKQILQTDRLYLREFVESDAAHILELLNSPGWLAFIGDRQVYTIEQAKRAITDNYRAHYHKHGFGFWAVCLKAGDTFIGMCGLVKRDLLDAVDIGYALLPAYVGQGYAYEAAQATFDYGYQTLKLPQIVAICDDNNVASIKLLEKLGLSFEKNIAYSDTETVALYA